MTYNYLNGTKLTDLKDLKSITSERNEAIDNFYKNNISPAVRSAGAHLRETNAARIFGKLNKGPLLDMTMDVWRDYELCRQFVKKVIEFCDKIEEKDPESRADDVQLLTPCQEKFDKQIIW